MLCERCVIFILLSAKGDVAGCGDDCNKLFQSTVHYPDTMHLLWKMAKSFIQTSNDFKTCFLFAETGEMWNCLSVWLTFELLKAFPF